VIQPLALLKQWEREIEEKTVPRQFKVFIYHGQNKKEIKKVKHLLEYDVVLTTYQTVSCSFLLDHPGQVLSLAWAVQVVLEWPDEDGMVAKAKKEAKKKGKPDDWENYLRFNKKEGVLFKANLYVSAGGVGPIGLSYADGRLGGAATESSSTRPSTSATSLPRSRARSPSLTGSSVGA
jgi:hypothetical protein